MEAKPLMPCARLQARLRAALLVADENGGRAIDDARRVARMVDVIDELHIGMRGCRHRIEAAHLAHLHEGGLELAERLHVGLRPHMLVFGKDGQAVDVPHRHDGLGKAPLVPGFRGALLRFDRIGIHVVARKTVFRRDQIGRDALRQEVGGDGEARIDGPCTA